jgi:hypothetical protein
MKSMLTPMMVALSLSLLACNKTESLADDVKKAYGGPFETLRAAGSDCKAPVEIAEKLFELEKNDHARVRAAVEGLKADGAFEGAVLERVSAVHDSPLAKSYLAACPVEARALGAIARKTAVAMGLEAVIPPWPAAGSVLLASPRSCALPSGVCFEFRGADYGEDRVKGRCDAMGGRVAETACSPNPRASRCQIGMGTELEHEIFDVERPEVAKARCEKPIEGKVHGKWIPAVEVASLGPSPGSSETTSAPTAGSPARPRSAGVAPAAPPPAPRAPRPSPGADAFY